MFDPVDPKQPLPKMEHGILQYWKEEDIFKRSVKQREGGETFSFYDGPPFATGLPHYGHLLAGTIKDVIPRYQAMCGKYVRRRFGWDCHGLPVENLIEKEHNIEDHVQIEDMGIGKFNDLCRGSVMRFCKEWREIVDRMGRWVDMDWDYRTMDPEYMESIWWVFSQLAEKDLIYEGHKPMHICPRCVTPLSNFEVTQGYKDITDQSVTVKFELADEPGTFVLAWTTTPWTLPGNLLLAISKKIDYVQVSCEGEKLILAKNLAEQILKDKEYKVEKEIKAKDLVGKKFKPLFSYFEKKYPDAFKIIEGNFVTTEEGTGVVHIAPGFGEDDFNVGKSEKLELLQHVTMDGKFVAEVTDFAGQEVKPADDPAKTDRKVIDWLKEKKKLFSQESYSHAYPHCWRCDAPLLNYATSSWFVAVEKIKEKMIKNNSKTEWVPGHIRDGRFGNWLEGARDWAISRNRYWGTPLPIWKSDAGDLTVIGSRDDLMTRQKIRFTKITILRHAESEGNLIPIYQAKIPGTDLTAKGKKSAKEAGKLLKDDAIDIIYCSPLARTVQTAKEIASEVGAEVVVDNRLREVSFGEYEGKTVDFDDLAFVKARRAHKMDTGAPESIYHFPGMETWKDVQTRIADFMNEILPKHRSQHILIVTHADPIQNIRHFFNKEDPMKISHQPYPNHVAPYTFFWDHVSNDQMDLHRESVDGIMWSGSKNKNSVELTLVRHGETDWNAIKKAHGHEDIPLNDKGREQAKKTAKNLNGQKFDIIITSPLSRAKETAEIISKELDVPISEMEELKERDIGDWNGKNIEEIMKKHPGVIKETALSSLHITPPKGESLTDFYNRVSIARNKLLEKYAGKKVLLVSHKGTSQALSILGRNLSYTEAILSALENGESFTFSLNPLLKRIPEVLDCWFESGSMPYAQEHFPFGSCNLDLGSSSKKPRTKNQEPIPSGFPADFIAEGIDQTRGWFYTLIVLSSALFDEPAFHHCIVNGIVLTEDGKKMSKRLKNYPEPTEVVEKYGADAIRYTLMSSPAVRGEDLRMSEKLIEESMRSVMLPLWNTYSFFVTYANAAGFEPVDTRRSSKNPLDQWIRAEVQDLCNSMTKELDNYDLSATCAELHDTIDALTNWYIRLSRRRFAGKGGPNDASDKQRMDMVDDDQLDALHTLYDVLLTLSQLLAPFCPYITDAIYLNLVSEDHGSVHLTDWPETRDLTKEEEALIVKTRLQRTIVSLGLSIRGDQKIKVRQPLSEATVAIPPSLKIDFNDDDVKLLKQELNVKELIFTEDPGSLAEAIVQVDARVAGPRLGARVQEIIKAGKEGEFKINDDGSIAILDEVMSVDEAQVVYRGKEGQNVAADRGVVVSVETAISADLELEGYARDLIRTIQRLRKESGLEFTDSVNLSVKGAEDVLKKFKDIIADETNAIFAENKGKEEKVKIGEMDIVISFEKR